MTSTHLKDVLEIADRYW